MPNISNNTYIIKIKEAIMSSYWIESTKNLSINSPPLTKNLEVDVLIIGAGLVGLSSAYYLLNSGLKTVILERDKICSKACGYIN